MRKILATMLRNEPVLFKACVGLSLGAHVLFFAGYPETESAAPQKDLKEITVTYRQLPQKIVEKKTVLQKDIEAVKPKPQPPKVEVLTRKNELLASLSEPAGEKSGLTGRFRLSRKSLPKIPTLNSDRRIQIPTLESDKITNPKYISYNESIRQRIRQRAYQYVNHPDFQQGNVHLSFALSADGGLQQIRVNDAKSRANDYLKKVGLLSVEESVPFPPFPEDLKFPELTFNVVISFEVNQ